MHLWYIIIVKITFTLKEREVLKMLTYKKAMNLLENSEVEFTLEYSKRVDIRSAIGRKQGSRHPELTSITFYDLDDKGTYAFVYVRGLMKGLCTIDELNIKITYTEERVDEDGKFDSWVSDIESAIKLLLPEILENYIEEDTEE